MRMNLIGSPVSRSGWYFKLSCRYAFFISETSAPWHTVTHHNNISEVSEVSRYISINLYSTITVNRQTDTRLASSFSRTTWISRHQKKPFWILMKQEMMEWQWHQLDHLQIICTSCQTDNHASNSSLNFFYRLDVLPNTKSTVSKHWRQNSYS